MYRFNGLSRFYIHNRSVDWLVFTVVTVLSPLGHRGPETDLNNLTFATGNGRHLHKTSPPPNYLETHKKEIEIHIELVPEV